MYDTANDDQIFTALKECFLNPKEAESKAAMAHEWYIQTGINRPLEIITFAINKAKSHTKNRSKKITKFRLLAEEAFHYQELSNKIRLRLEPYLNPKRS
jgi:hypothetical protein